jgi:hypothetical protein
VEVAMGRENKMAIAKQVLAESVGAMVNSLEFAFIWEYNGEIFFSFQINEPDHAQNGSTLSVNVSKIT